LIEHGAEITVSDDNVWTIRLNKGYKFKAHAMEILNKIRIDVTMKRYIKSVLMRWNNQSWH